MLEEELRAFEGLVQTYRALFGEEISDSITQADQVADACRDQSSSGAANLCKNSRTHQSHVESVQDEDSDHWVASREHRPNHQCRLDASRTRARAMEKKTAKGKGKRKARAREKERKMGRTGRSSRDGVPTAESGATKLATVGIGKKSRCTRYKSGAVEATACSCSSQIAVKRTDDVAKEKAFIDEQVQADTKRRWLFMIAAATTSHQPSCNGGAHSFVVESGAYVHECPKSYASHTLLQALPERWRGLDLRSASGKTLKVWGMREVAYNALDVDGKVFTSEDSM